jgi:hypothetical protein
VYVFDHHQVKLQLLHTYTQSSSLHTTGAKLQRRVLALSLSLPCSQQYRCCYHYFYHLYYYYFFCALTLSPFLFYSGRVVVLAATTTGFSFLFFPFSVFLFFFLSMLTLFPISKHTALLTGCYKKEHDDERTFRVIVRKREKQGKTRRLPRHSPSDTKACSF